MVKARSVYLLVNYVPTLLKNTSSSSVQVSASLASFNSTFKSPSFWCLEDGAHNQTLIYLCPACAGSLICLSISLRWVNLSVYFLSLCQLSTCLFPCAEYGSSARQPPAPASACPPLPIARPAQPVTNRNNVMNFKKIKINSILALAN